MYNYNYLERAAVDSDLEPLTLTLTRHYLERAAVDSDLEPEVEQLPHLLRAAVEGVHLLRVGVGVGLGLG